MNAIHHERAFAQSGPFDASAMSSSEWNIGRQTSRKRKARAQGMTLLQNVGNVAVYFAGHLALALLGLVVLFFVYVLTRPPCVYT